MYNSINLLFILNWLPLFKGRLRGSIENYIFV